jgi:cytochrome c oxidase cbb3-type subunit 3
MCFRCLEITAILIALVLSGCSREKRPLVDDTPPQMTQALSQSSLQVGGGALIGFNSDSPETQAFAMSEGKRLYEWFNCAGCHAQGGGGAIGPPLMDDKWIYGSAPQNIFATIVEGRPNGMPSFRGRIPDKEMWQIVAYVRALSGQARKDAAPSRSDHLSTRPSEQEMTGAFPQPAAVSDSTQR